MPVTLKDAQISVKVNVERQSKDLDSLEKRTKKQREDADRSERKWKKTKGDFGGRAARGVSVARGAVSAGLYQTIVGIIRSLPFGIGTAGAAGIAAAEMNERYGPLIQGIMEKQYGEDLKFVKGLRKALDVAGWATNPLMKSIFGDPSGASRDWSKVKSSLTSIGTGLEAGLGVGAADVLSGGSFTPEEFAEVFGLTREYARAQSDLMKARRRMKLRRIGQGVTRSAEAAIREAMDNAKAQR